MELETMRFSNPEFHTLLNYTVSLGEKWKSRVAIGDFVSIEGFHGIGEVAKIYVTRLASIPQEVLDGEHDPKCQTWDGLVRILKEVYPELADIGGEQLENTVVTCVGIYILKYL